jgi:hypothetical protein
MALRVEGVVDGGVEAEQPLRGAGRFEPLHLALSSSHDLMRVFGAIVRAAPLLTPATQAKSPKDRRPCSDALGLDPCSTNLAYSLSSSWMYSSLMRYRRRAHHLRGIEAVVIRVLHHLYLYNGPLAYSNDIGRSDEDDGWVEAAGKCLRNHASINFVPDDLSAFHVPLGVHLHTGPDRGLNTRSPILLECDQRFAVWHSQV